MARKRGWDPVLAAGVPRSPTPGEPLDVTPSKPVADPEHPTPHDPVPPPPPPEDAASRNIVAERMQRALSAMTEAPPLVPPAPAAPPPAGPAFRVMETKIINLRHGITTLAKGSVVRPTSHDIDDLRQQGVLLDPV